MNQDKLNRLRKDLKKSVHEVQKHQTNLHDETGRILIRPYKQLCKNFNTDFLLKSEILIQKAEACMNNVTILLKRYSQLFQTKRKLGRSTESNSRRKKKNNKRKAQKRKCIRQQNRMRGIMTLIVPHGSINFKENKDFDAHKIKLEVEFGTVEMCDIHVSGVKQLQSFDAAGLFVLLEKNDIFSHKAKCVILENLPVQVENDYWHFYDSSMSEESASEKISQSN